MRWYETEDLKLVIEGIDQDAVLLLWITEKYKIDLRILLFLYDKYGKDLWFFFYMFAGISVNFPSVERFLKMIKDVQDVFSGKRVESVVGRYAMKLIGKGKVVLDLRDRQRFPFGVMGLIESREIEKEEE